MTHLTYTALYEQASDGGWSAHVPDLPTILVGADTRQEVEVLVHEAVELYLEDLREQGLPIPLPLTYAANVQVAA
jgi:predicted RNase H-like HicB family nuclease